MNDIRKPGRPKNPQKHLNEEHHFKMSDQADDTENEEPFAVDSMVHDLPSEKEESPIVVGKVVVEKVIEQIISDLDSQEEPVIDGDGRRHIKTVVDNGRPVFLFESLSGRGTLAFRKKTRVLNPKAKKWETAERWYEHLTGFPIDFEPLYWQEKL